MPILTTQQVKVINPLLTRVVQGYAQGEFVFNTLFPAVEVTSRSGKVIEFNKSDFAIFNTRRSPGAATRRRPIGYGDRDYQLYQDSLEGELPIEFIEEAAATGVPFDLQREAAEAPMRSILLNLEVDQANIATNASNYDDNHKVTLSGTDQWGQGASVISQINQWREAVRSSIGVYPNRAIIGPSAFLAAIEDPDIRDYFKHTSSDSVTEEMLARTLRLESLKVATTKKLNELTGDLEDVCGDSVVLGYVPTTISSRRTPSYGYTYTLRGYPVAEEPYYDKNHKTWYFPATAERQPQLTAMAAGFLAQNVSGVA